MCSTDIVTLYADAETMLCQLLCSENTSLDAGMTKSVSHPACAVVYSMVMVALMQVSVRVTAVVMSAHY